ncbi:ATP-binding protein [Janthinobacterium sp. RB2R34]|uniref:ATP-binding protein n=1 Tax=Janthinobacterium sp. RB2R34 TaxID=3424193 RepID=UPI003F1FC615
MVYSGFNLSLMDTVHAHDIQHLLDAEHRALGAVAAGASLEDTLAQLLLALQGDDDTDGDQLHSCIALIDEADRFCGLCAPNLPDDLRQALRHDDNGPHPSPFGAAAFTGAPVYCGDIAREPGWSAGRKEAMLHGYRACWVAPVFGARGHVLGVLGQFYQVARHPTQVDIDRMNLAARCISHVIERDRLEQLAGHNAALESRLLQRTAERDRSEQALQLVAFAHRQPWRPPLTNLGQLLGSMQALIRRALGELIIEETFVSVGLWPVLVDPAQMKNVLLNMAINAREAMEQGGRLTFSVSNVTLDQAATAGHADALPGQYVLLTITDTGHGMDAEVIEQIFDPLFTTKEEGEGAGMGLSMADGFIRQSGGHIRVQSAPGAGTTFKIYLPRSLEGLPLR